MAATQKSLYLVYIGIVLCMQVLISLGAMKTFRDHYIRHRSTRLSSIPTKRMMNSSVEQCAEHCIKETVFYCKSFDVDNARRHCLLFMVDDQDRDVSVIEDPNVDHYEGAFIRMFDQTSNHQLYTWMEAAHMHVTVEQCARICILETQFKCMTFNYNEQESSCRLTSHTEEDSHGIISDPDQHFYRRRTEGALSQFINYGHRSLTPLKHTEIYQKSIVGVLLEDCADLCLQESTFNCVSFNFLHEADQSTCHLSKYIAANTYGLATVSVDVRINHYERIEEYLAYFYPTPYSVLLGNNLKTYKFVTPNRCALMCMQEESFVCRSFDYEIQEGSCQLSDKTGSDVGGLYYEETEEVHHFEMKPLLGCGGNLTSLTGNFASPEWPRNYAHHERCEWNIRVPVNKVIQFTLTHLDFNLESMDHCSEDEDRLEVLEPGVTPYCVVPFTRTITTQGNVVTLVFHSNGQVDAQGFRVFYKSEWTCNSNLKEAPGDFASPHWPTDYDSMDSCTWRLSAPEGYRVKLYFTSFELEEHPLGHCSESFDHVKIQDGGTVSAPKIGLYCGKKEPFVIKSTGTDMLVQFRTDKEVVSEGFHATFVFEKNNGSIVVTHPKDPEDKDPVDLDNGDGGFGDRNAKSKSVEDTDTRQDEISSSEETHSRENEVGGEGDSKKVRMSGSHDMDTEKEFRQYRTAMWAVITLMIILLLSVLVVLFLVWRHYERKLRHFGEIFREEDKRSPEEIPLQMTDFAPAKQNNTLLGNEVDICNGAVGSSQGACGGASTDRSYNKYTKDNVKNVNLDTKYTEDKECGKSNLNQSPGGNAHNVNL